MARCKATTKSGEKCRAPAVRGDRCLIHSDPGMAASLAAKSVDRRRKDRATAARRAGEMMEAPTTPAEMLVAVCKAAADVRNGDLHPDIGRCMCGLAAVYFNGMKVTDLAERLAAMERAMTTVQNRKAGV